MTVLTVIAGAVDAVSFLTLAKVFCALVTGDVLFLREPAALGGDLMCPRREGSSRAPAPGAPVPTAARTPRVPRP
ncbi:DUF1275 family protein [Streptomyces cellulosae]|uniref:DUF1275 family protein n=1 Tax=Streptomyces cellulosae TaxID=1968 RepID=A0ABW6JMI3_STRCE|nr:DUF1275 family protein [Streptomyces sp. AC04842]